MNKTINIAEDFSKFPSGREVADGPYSGEKFRKEHLLPALMGGCEEIIIILDGVKGYPSSFSDEAFGGLVRIDNFQKDELLKRFNIKYKSPHYKSYKNDIIKFIQEA